jgi:hypothetical protein
MTICDRKLLYVSDFLFLSQNIVSLFTWSCLSVVIVQTYFFLMKIVLCTSLTNLLARVDINILSKWALLRQA